MSWLGRKDKIVVYLALLIALIAGLIAINIKVSAINIEGEINFESATGGTVTFGDDFNSSTVEPLAGFTGFTNFTYNAVNIGTVGFDCDFGDDMNVTDVYFNNLTYTISGAGNQTVYYRGRGLPTIIVGGTIVVGPGNTLIITTLGAGPVFLEWGANLTLVSLTASDSRIDLNITININANITWANGTAYIIQPVLIQGVNSTHLGAGIWQINQTELVPGAYNYTDIQTTTENLTGALTVIWDFYNIEVGALFTEVQAGFNSLIFANGSSVVDGHVLTDGDTVTINGVALGWNSYMGRFESAVSSGVPAIVTYDTLTALLETTYAITGGNITAAPTITWVTPRLDEVTPFLRDGDWPGAIIEMNVLLMGETLFWTFLLMTVSMGVYNYAGSEVTLMVWMLGWSTFSVVIHGQAQTIALIMMAVGGGVYIAKFFLDRRTTV